MKGKQKSMQSGLTIISAVCAAGVLYVLYLLNTMAL